MSNEDISTDQSQTMTQMSTNLSNLSKYMKFVGLLMMIGGVIYCITIIGAIIGVPYYLIGKRLRESADAFADYNSSSSVSDLETAIGQQTRAFFIMYILAIIGLVLIAIYIVVLLAMLASGAF